MASRSGSRLGFIGLGAAGRGVVRLMAADAAGGWTIAGALVRHQESHRAFAAEHDIPLVEDIDALLATRPGVVVEVAGHAGLEAYGERVLRAGCDLVTIAVGALTDPALFERLRDAAVEGHARLIVPSGAISGIDGVGAARTVGIDSVRHTVRKPVVALIDDPDRAAEIMAGGTAVTLFEGSAREGATRYPANVNVAALVGLAGIGPDRTELAVIADPTIDQNTHEVEVRGPFGSIEVRVRNTPSPDNPRTGLIVAGSVFRTLQRLDSPVLIGG